MSVKASTIYYNILFNGSGLFHEILSTHLFHDEKCSALHSTFHYLSDMNIQIRDLNSCAIVSNICENIISLPSLLMYGILCHWEARKWNYCLFIAPFIPYQTKSISSVWPRVFQQLFSDQINNLLFQLQISAACLTDISHWISFTPLLIAFIIHTLGMIHIYLLMVFTPSWQKKKM